MKILSQRYLDKSPLNFASRLDLDLNLGILLNEFLPLWEIVAIQQLLLIV